MKNKAYVARGGVMVAQGPRFPVLSIRVLLKYDAQCPHIVVVFVRALRNAVKIFTLWHFPC